MAPDAVDDALAEAARRASRSDRDVSAAVAHVGAVVRDVCRDWELTVERWLPGGAGTPPLAVTRADGTPAVLKIAEPGDQDVAARVMTAARGRGYAAVLDQDLARGALLLERLGPSLADELPGLRDQGEVVVPLLREAWRVPLAAGRPFEGKARGLLGILADLGPRYGTGHEAAMAVATTYAAELAESEVPEVVCHGDPHAANVLRRGDGWALVDPDGFVGERAYDLGVVARDACAELTSRPWLVEECRRLAGRADVDPDRVWRWAFVERVTSGLYLRWHGHRRESARFLAAASRLVEG